jgi:hypothetical protein
MKTSSVSLSAVLLGCVLASSSIGLAQTTAGLLGQRYAGLSVFTESIRDSNISNGFGGGAGLNVPLTPYLDFGASGTFESFRDYDLKDNRAFAGLTAYHDFNALKAFADASIGGTWQSSKVGGVSYSNNSTIYGVGGGIELPFSDRSALFARLAYNKYSQSGLGHYMTYAGGASHWFNEKLGATVTVTFFESDSVTFALGAMIRF